MERAETYLLAEGRLCDYRRVWVVYGYASVKFTTSPNEIPMHVLAGTSVEAIRAVAARGSLRAFAIISNEDGSPAYLTDVWNRVVRNLRRSCCCDWG